MLIQPAAAEDEYGPDSVYIDPYEYDCGYDEQEPELTLKTGDAL